MTLQDRRLMTITDLALLLGTTPIQLASFIERRGIPLSQDPRTRGWVSADAVEQALADLVNGEGDD